MQKFKAGDRVRVIRDPWSMGIGGKLATVISVNPLAILKIKIQIDDCTGVHPNADFVHTMWSVEANEIELVSDVDRITDVAALLPLGAQERKAVPLASGVMDYFPAALAEVAKVSFKGNEQHNPGQPLHWARGKSTDHADTMLRHFLERGTIDTDGTRHSAKMVWRALALLQMELEHDGYPTARGAR